MKSVANSLLSEFLSEGQFKVVDFSLRICNNSGIVTGNDTAILLFFDQELVCRRKNER